MTGNSLITVAGAASALRFYRKNLAPYSLLSQSLIKN
jgi:hypothetical protein